MSPAPRCPALVAALLACTPTDPPPPRAAPPVPAPAATTRELALLELRLQVPAAFVPLESDRVANLREAALREAPGGVVQVAGVRAPDGLMHGLVYLQQGVIPRDTATRPLTVRRTLERMRDDLRVQALAVGGEPGSFTFAERGDGLQGCFTVIMRQDDRSIETRTCTRLDVPDPDHARIRVGTCMADAARTATLCDPILATLEFTPASAIPLDDRLPANATLVVPLAGVAHDRVHGVVFGSSPAEFAAACTAAGLRVDAAPPSAPDAQTAGRVVECSGLPGAPDFAPGPVVRTVAVFTDDKLSIASIQLDAAIDAVERHIHAAYPETQADPGRIVHRIDDDAVDDALLRVTVAEPPEPRDHRTIVQFTSARGARSGPAL